MLRKEAWFEMMEEYEEIADILKNNVKKEYHMKIKHKVQKEKERIMELLKLGQRHGQRQVLSIVDMD